MRKRQLQVLSRSELEGASRFELDLRARLREHPAIHDSQSYRAAPHDAPGQEIPHENRPFRPKGETSPDRPRHRQRPPAQHTGDDGDPVSRSARVGKGERLGEHEPGDEGEGRGEHSEGDRLGQADSSSDDEKQRVHPDGYPQVCDRWAQHAHAVGDRGTAHDYQGERTRCADPPGRPTQTGCRDHSHPRRSGIEDMPTVVCNDVLGGNGDRSDGSQGEEVCWYGHRRGHEEQDQPCDHGRLRVRAHPHHRGEDAVRQVGDRDEHDHACQELRGREVDSGESRQHERVDSQEHQTEGHQVVHGDVPPEGFTFFTHGMRLSPPP